ncbi:chemotaxis response regulator protein-glutamate methylesterase [Betaproteobacteria bacterium GR16-43]|nr:chemotaxis response regulator protein-glutamate methylesterase [Betaproteobacteria bacterium GR16-43]
MAIRVLIVEDSPLMQRLLSTILGAQDDIKVAGIAGDPIDAREKIKQLKPDVLTLDVEMPRMDGITFLERLMRLRPMPVVMVSSLTEANAEVTLRALELGAIDFATKPSGEGSRDLHVFGLDLIEKVREAAQAEVRPLQVNPRPVASEAVNFRPGSLIAVGGSTGATEMIRELLERLPPNSPPVAIVQHMPEMFTRMFARRLDDLCALKVTEAENGEVLQAGHAYIAPGDWHLRVDSQGADYVARIDQEPAVNRHRPAVDVLFESAARAAGSKAAGVLLTGMGRDGAEGLGKLKRAGAATFAQDEASCVVYGMPRAAIEAGYAGHVGDVATIAGRLVEVLRR